MSSEAASAKSINWIRIGGFSGLAAVGMGAFGAHGLMNIVDPEQIKWWVTAAQYHLLHSVVLVCFGLLRRTQPGSGFAGCALCLGILLFSGTLYAMGLGAPRWFGAITPLGGVALMTGWLGLAQAAKS